MTGTFCLNLRPMALSESVADDRPFYQLLRPMILVSGLTRPYQRAPGRRGDSSPTEIADLDLQQAVIGPHAKTNWDGRRRSSRVIGESRSIRGSRPRSASEKSRLHHVLIFDLDLPADTGRSIDYDLYHISTVRLDRYSAQWKPLFGR